MPTIEAVACTVCGCVCDDLRITVENDRITNAERACVLAEPWFAGQNTQHPPIAESHGQPIDITSALDQAASLLKQSQAPLIYGLSRSTTEGQRAAVALAEKLGGTIDTTAATGHAASLMALQQVGESTCTLGEVRNRADLVIYWSSDPLTTHPRHLERYSMEPKGRFVPDGRTLIVVDHQPSATSAIADRFIQIPPGKDWEALSTLRALIKGIEPDASWNGGSIDEWRKLAERMKTCRFGIVFFGVQLTREGIGHRQVEALLTLVTELNAHTRFYARRMRRLGDVAGADSVLTWQTGYPFGVNFGRGYPRYNPGEFSGPEMLARREVDLCLFVGSETGSEFSPSALEHLRSIPVIALESPGTVTVVPPTIRFTTAVYGVHRTGTAYRMDEVPIPLRVLLPTPYPSDGEILSELLTRVSQNR